MGRIKKSMRIQCVTCGWWTPRIKGIPNIMLAYRIARMWMLIFHWCPGPDAWRAHA